MRFLYISNRLLQAFSFGSTPQEQQFFFSLQCEEDEKDFVRTVEDFIYGHPEITADDSQPVILLNLPHSTVVPSVIEGPQLEKVLNEMWGITPEEADRFVTFRDKLDENLSTTISVDAKLANFLNRSFPLAKIHWAANPLLLTAKRHFLKEGAVGTENILYIIYDNDSITLILFNQNRRPLLIPVHDGETDIKNIAFFVDLIKRTIFENTVDPVILRIAGNSPKLKNLTEILMGQGFNLQYYKLVPTRFSKTFFIACEEMSSALKTSAFLNHTNTVNQ